MTITVRVEKLLKEYLDELDKVQLREFQWYLHQTEIEGTRHIPKSKLENITREETADILVEVYGEDGAVETTVDVFFRMNHNHLATRLIQAQTERKEKQSHVAGSSAERKNQRNEDSTGTQDLSCSLCSDVFTEPVMLQCGHSCCRSCIHSHWKGKITRKCPLCKQDMPDTEPPINLALKSLIEKCRQRSRDGPSGGQRNDSYQIPSNNNEEKREAFEKVKRFCDSSIERIKSQSFCIEKKIKVEFEELHGLLKKEEETRLAALRDESTQKIRMMQLITEVNRNTLTLSDAVKKTEKFETDVSFVQNSKMEMERIQDLHALIDEPKHLGNLQLTVLEKTVSFVRYRMARSDIICSLHQGRNDVQEPSTSAPMTGKRKRKRLS